MGSPQETAPRSARVVIIGAGQAGSTLAAKLRELGHAGPVTLIGAEPALPYERPPLSKGYFLGDVTREELFLRPQRYYDDHCIEVVTGTPVHSIDRDAQRLSYPGGTIEYDVLALTTGSIARRLPARLGGELSGVFAIRSLTDIDALAGRCAPGRRVLIVGGGYIGLETASVFRKSGLRVTLVEAAERILQRVAAPQTSDYFRELHQGRGVEVIEGVGLSALTGEAGAVTGAVLTDGRIIEADLVVVGIGVDPATALAEEAGLHIDNGIAVDESGRTSDPSIWAAGDCTSFPFRGERVRLESVPHAVDQATAVARNIAGADSPYQAEPWFWSDQYDVKLQIAGFNRGYDQVVVRPGSRDGAVSHWYFGDGALLAVDAVNDSRSYMIGRRALQDGRAVDPEQVADPAADLKALILGSEARRTAPPTESLHVRKNP